MLIWVFYDFCIEFIWCLMAVLRGCLYGFNMYSIWVCMVVRLISYVICLYCCLHLLDGLCDHVYIYMCYVLICEAGAYIVYCLSCG